MKFKLNERPICSEPGCTNFAKIRKAPNPWEPELTDFSTKCQRHSQTNYTDKNRRHQKVRRNLNKIKLLRYLTGKGCSFCTEVDLRTLQFDHRDPDTKEHNITTMINHGVSWTKVLNEISKCQILCANCHAKRTSTQQDWFKGRVN